ncbi:zinc-dependent alcohol dehydrogenase family protein [Bradyrhizobium sp. CCBAU 45384]|uniref:zinc-dependent alcohol dehydrogenase family protein n=1 Tax=Bradyrhizobium sp. CCBAU 45384 TaxID=858428 RepID=UPI00230587CE|nr:zinc-dependent alcohol dehydrogenase family protein [Bradyrhizobium sp. CCBAU 45384]MDA9412891.1 hypothetical protein [Bradyrhizobium sp. CCBAU 45384]
MRSEDEYYQRAIVRNFGPAERVVKIETYRPPPLATDHVLVRMTHCAINPSDIITISGAYAHRTELPFVPGYEGVGVVEATGGDSLLNVGDRVWPLGSAGAWQKFKVTDSRWCFRVPAGLSDEQAAFAYVNPLTALLLSRSLMSSPALHVAVNAAGSAIGRILIKLANRVGIRPIAIVRNPRSLQLLSDLNLRVTLVEPGDRLSALIAEVTSGAGLDIVFDAVGGEEGARLASGLRVNGVHLHYGLLSGTPLPVSLTTTRPDIDLRFFRLRDWVHFVERGELAREMTAVSNLIQCGVAATPVEACYPLAKIGQALAHNAREGRRGKILVTC